MTDKKVPVYAATLTDAGGRRINEDAVYDCRPVEDEKIATRGRLYIVADGTGGQEGGQTASSMATTIISERFYDDGSPDVGESLRAAITTAHTALYELAQKVSSWAEMSTTIVTAVIRRGMLYVAHVGDSRAYLVRNGEARLLTRDHVWLEDDENYGALMRWLGGAGKPSVEVDLLAEALQEDDVVVLCSDGLTDVVDRTDIGTLAGRSSPQVVARQLVELANRRGTGDNVSVAIIKYGGKAPVTPARRWAWLGGGGAVLLAVIVALALALTNPGSGDERREGQSGDQEKPTPVLEQPTATPTLPTRIEVDVTVTAAPTEAGATAEATRRPTSTPIPPTDTPTPTPTRIPPTSTPTPTEVVATVEPTSPSRPSDPGPSDPDPGDPDPGPGPDEPPDERP